MTPRESESRRDLDGRSSIVMDTVLLAYCAYENLAHSRIAKVPVAWLGK